MSSPEKQIEPYQFTNIKRISLIGEVEPPRLATQIQSRPALVDEIIIRESNPFRQLPSRTQVISGLIDPTISNRFTHSVDIEVNTLKVCHSHPRLRLNEDLLRAISISHDIGQGPFSHLYEDVARDELKINFDHKVFGVMLTTGIENFGTGLRLTEETNVGILAHTLDSRRTEECNSSLTNFSNEQNLVMYYDKNCYLFSDICDFEKYGYQILAPKDYAFINSLFPGDILNPNSPYANKSARIDRCTNALIGESLEKGYVAFEDSEEAKNIRILREYMLENIYKDNNRFSRPHYYGLIQKFFDNFHRIEGMSNYDPIIIGAQLTDPEFVKVVNNLKKLNEPGVIKLEVFNGTSVLPKIKKGYLEGKTYLGLIDQLKPLFPQFKF